jgi:Concanavalin A-like lectin/glucanases superfamily
VKTQVSREEQVILRHEMRQHYPASTLSMRFLQAALLAILTLTGSLLSGQSTEVWRFDKTSALGSHPAKALGHPQLIDTPVGKAVQFNGVNDALFVGVHPLAGTQTWTWEVIFRPDADGAAAQRFFHLSVLDPATGKDLDDRLLFEIRILNGQWCLDSFAMAGGHSKTLLNCEKLHPLGRWYRVTAVYNGKTLKNYVGDELQGEGDVELVPQRPGHSSVGVRINLKDYFKGAIFEARFTRRSLAEQEFLKMPSGMK